MRILKGIGITKSIAYGSAYVYKHKEIVVPHNKISEEDVDGEVASFHKAVDSLLNSYKILDSDSNEERKLKEVYQLFLKDPEFDSQVKVLIKDKLHNAAWAIEAVASHYIKFLENTPDEYFKDRILDLKDVKERLLSTVLNRPFGLSLTEARIIVADYLLPSELLSVPSEFIKGIALEFSGKTSHVAILAHSANIPAVFSLVTINDVESGDLVILDGEESELVLEPTDKAIDEAIRRIENLLLEKETLKRLSNLPSITKDGREIKLYANVGDLDGVKAAIKDGSEGIGLFRTEFLYLNKEYLNSEDKRSAVYDEAVSLMKDVGPVTIRTVDLGGDKTIGELGVDEENPYLGLRSIRFCLANKELFHSQLVAILKASALGKVKLMFPMITGIEELQGVLDYLEEVKEELRKEKIPFDENIPIGSMIEVPSAALTSDEIAKKVDFMSIGTNDLIQYTIAVDRGNEKVSYLYESLHPAVLKLLKLIIDNGKANGTEVAICGEMAGEVENIALLIGLGVEELSMAPGSLLAAKAKIRALDYSDTVSLAEKVLKLSTVEEIKKELREFNGKTGNKK